jgi:pyruvate,water dikinase
VRAAARAYAGEDAARSPDALARRQHADRRDAERELLGVLPIHRRAPTRLLLRVGRTWIARRELGKSGFLQAIDAGRAAARVIGETMAAQRTLRDPDDVFFLTFDEVMDAAPPNAAAVVTGRRARRDGYRDVVLPAVWVGQPRPVVGLADTRTDDRVVTGVPVAPGRVVGRARVVRDAGDCEVPIAADEVLVTRTTDPSWVSLFLTAAGLAIDIGGPMSHGAIVARELGIPCVINTGDGTRRIPDGSRVELDGDAGVVRVLDPG